MKSKIALEWYEQRKGVQITRPGHFGRNSAISYYKFKAFLKQYLQPNGELKHLPKGEPWLNAVGLVDLQPDKQGNLKVTRKAIAIYVWDTKKIIAIIQVPDNWYLQHKTNVSEFQDFESIFVTQRNIAWITVNDPIPGPIINRF